MPNFSCLWIKVYFRRMPKAVRRGGCPMFAFKEMWQAQQAHRLPFAVPFFYSFLFCLRKLFGMSYIKSMPLDISLACVCVCFALRTVLYKFPNFPVEIPLVRWNWAGGKTCTCDAALRGETCWQTVGEGKKGLHHPNHTSPNKKRMPSQPSSNLGFAHQGANVTTTAQWLMTRAVLWVFHSPAWKIHWMLATPHLHGPKNLWSRNEGWGRKNL